MKLYHTSSKKIDRPDVDYGRRNADFGGGFYLSDCIDFAKKWAESIGQALYYSKMTGKAPAVAIAAFE